jgi:starch synthase
MACGTPVIASRVGAVPDIIENGRTGIIVELKDVEGLKKALVRLMENRELARKMGERGRERVEKEFTWDAVCKKLEKFYGEVVRRDV